MPDGGPAGWYADWWNDGERGEPSWETYELDDVLPAIEHRYLIKPQRRDHALVGISMGGLGATYLGGRLPGFFGSVATLSGFVDPGAFPAVVDPAVGLTSAALFKGDHNPDPVYGPPSGFYFKGHNPTQLAANLRHTRVFESTGNGVPSKSGLQHLTTGGTTAIPSGTALEAPIIHPMNQFYVRALRRVHVNVTYQDHPGGHDIPDFIDEVKAAIRWGLFKSVPEHPTRWTNDTVATHGSLWGIGYHFTRPPTRVVRFHRSGNRLSISRAGSSVTLRLAGGRVIRTRTPAIVRLR
jgi:S-formylglutathione hydrolase FrmB